MSNNINILKTNEEEIIMSENVLDNIKQRKVKTGTVILTNLYLFEPREYKKSGNKKYSATIIIPKKERETLRATKQAIRAAIEEGKNIYGGVIPERSKLMLPLKNGDDYSVTNLIYANSIYLNATSNYKPRVIDKNDNKVFPYNLPINVYGQATLLFNAYNIKETGNKGISCQLLEVKLLDGDVNPTEMLLNL